MIYYKMGVQIITKCGIVMPTSEKDVVASKRKHKKQTHKREERKDMKKKNSSTKVVAIATIAVVVLAGISAVSVSSLVKSDEARLGSISGIDSADSASGKAGTRPDAVLKVADVEEAAPAVAEAPVYEAVPFTEADIVPVEVEVVVNGSQVEEKASPQDVPPVIAVDQTVEEPEVAEPELKLAAAEPVFFAAAEEPVVQEEAVFEIAEEVVEEEYVPELVFGEGYTVDGEAAWDWEGQYDEFAGYEDVAYEEPVYEEPVYEEPVYEEPVYVDPAAGMEYVPEDTAAADVAATVPVSGTTSSVRQDLVNYALSRVGVTPYVWAGRSLDTGTDCSGFVNLIYDNFGYYASAGSDDYQNVEGDWGTNISYDELQVGDVVVYRDGGHVGIYAGQDEYGNDIVVHDSNEVEGVKVSDMNYTDPTAYVRIIND